MEDVPVGEEFNKNIEKIIEERGDIPVIGQSPAEVNVNVKKDEEDLIVVEID